MALLKPEAVAFTGPRLLALTRAVHRTRGDCLYDGLLLQGIACEWLHNVYKCGGFYCPVCLNIWSTPAKRDACEHLTGSGEPKQFHLHNSAEEEKTLRHWQSMAEKDNYNG